MRKVLVDLWEDVLRIRTRVDASDGVSVECRPSELEGFCYELPVIQNADHECAVLFFPRSATPTTAAVKAQGAKKAALKGTNGKRVHKIRTKTHFYLPKTLKLARAP
ncbi:hypothetical protein HKX48_005607, partial [Thoreauomyces humboldtii]